MIRKFIRPSALLLIVSLTCRAMDDPLYHAFAPEPVVDRWMYANNFSGGSRPSASTFSALPVVTGDDDRLAQIVVKFDTVAAGVPSGLGAENYHLSRVVFTVVISDSLNLYYDPTEDDQETFRAGGIPDSDLGRPFEVFGTGFRNGYTAATFMENSSFSGGSRPQRNAFALGFDAQGVARDVTNQITENFAAMPWAIGQVTNLPEGESSPVPLLAGASIPTGAMVTFSLNLSIPGVSDYVKQSLHEGHLWLTLTSLHASERLGASGYPGYYCKENIEHQLFGDLAPQLELEYTLPMGTVFFSRDPASQMCHIQWNALPGFSYSVQSCRSLLPGEWVDVSPTPFRVTTPSILSWTTHSPEGTAFFRIQRRP